MDNLATTPGFALINVNAELLTASEAFHQTASETRLFSIMDNRVRLPNRTNGKWAAELTVGSLITKRAIVSRSPCDASALIATPLRHDAAIMAILLRIATAPCKLSLDHELLTALFDLTPAELAVAERMALGDTIQEAAASRRVSVNTARTHLKRLFAKTGARRQADLLRALLAGATA